MTIDTPTKLHKALKEALERVDRQEPGAFEALLTASVNAARMLVDQQKQQHGRANPDTVRMLRVVLAANARASKPVANPGETSRGTIKSRETSLRLIAEAQRLARDFGRAQG